MFTLILVTRERNSITLGRPRKLKFQFPLCFIRINCKRKVIQTNNQSRAVIPRVTYRQYTYIYYVPDESGGTSWPRANYFSPFLVKHLPLAFISIFRRPGNRALQALRAIYLCYLRALGMACLKKLIRCPRRYIALCRSIFSDRSLFCFNRRLTFLLLYRKRSVRIATYRTNSIDQKYKCCLITRILSCFSFPVPPHPTPLFSSHRKRLSNL